ncbi:MAG: hypothetical protein DRO46_02395 [Candidatus Hecatellales archaeon]|nr:MAG: hypothetical protein DRO46_02395 [Candidatus Hecatellales archaeon]
MKMFFDEGELEWVKLPHDLQQKFFELAGKEAERLAEVIGRFEEQLEDLRRMLGPHFKRLPSSSSLSLVAAVDSSRSPRLSERLGVRYGVFASGVVFLKGVEKRAERFEPGIFKRKQVFSQDKSRFTFSLITTYVERKMALEALDECDFLILDGSFYGFVYGAHAVKRSGLYGDVEDKLLRETFDATEALRKSGKVVGVIKRSHTRAIGGYLALKDKNNPFLSMIDKLILSVLMPARNFFKYRDFLGETPVQVYSRLAGRALAKKLGEEPLEEAEEMVFTPFENLGLEVEGFREMRRLQVKCYEGLPPCEIEYPLKLGEEKLLNFLGEKYFFNEVTNLPLALDLVDSLVNLSAKFTEEFVSEVEGRVLETLLEKRERFNAVKAFFAFLNPQKIF